jgi:Tfp pilus assembly protein FimT
VRIQASGKTVLVARAGRIKVCDPKGCLDLLRALRR